MPVDLIAVAGHAAPLACSWRNHRSGTHEGRRLGARLLRVRFLFEAMTEEGRACVADFALVRPMEAWLKDTFAGAVLVAADDPMAECFRAIDKFDLWRLVEAEAVGCEAFAEMVLAAALAWIADTYGEQADFRLRVVEVREVEGAAEAMACDRSSYAPAA